MEPAVGFEPTTDGLQNRRPQFPHIPRLQLPAYFNGEITKSHFYLSHSFPSFPCFYPLRYAKSGMPWDYFFHLCFLAWANRLRLFSSSASLNRFGTPLPRRPRAAACGFFSFINISHKVISIRVWQCSQPNIQPMNSTKYHGRPGCSKPQLV